MKFQHKIFEKRQQTIPKKIVQLNDEVTALQIKGPVQDGIAEILDMLAGGRGSKLIQMARHDHNEQFRAPADTTAAASQPLLRALCHPQGTQPQ